MRPSEPRVVDSASLNDFRYPISPLTDAQLFQIHPQPDRQVGLFT